MNELTLIPVLAMDVTLQEVDDEILILDRRDNKIHQLNSTAAFIWKKCDGSKSIEYIINSLVDAFEITPEQAASDVLDTVQQFQQNNLLKLI